MTSLTWADYAAFAAVVATLVGLPISIALYLLTAVREEVRGFGSRITKAEERLDQLAEQKLNEIDFLRLEARTMNRIDHMAEQVALANGKLDGLTGFNRAAAQVANEIKAVAKALDQTTERPSHG